MALNPDLNANPSHEIPFAVQSCRPVVRLGRCGTFCDWVTTTDFPESTSPKLQIVATDPEAKFTLSWRLNSGAQHREEFGGSHIILIPAGVPHAMRWRRPAGLFAVSVDIAFIEATIPGRVIREVSCLLARRYVAHVPLIGEICAEAWAECQRPGMPSQTVTGSLGGALAAQVLRAHFKPTEGSDAHRWQLMRSKMDYVMSYMAENPTEEFTLEGLAKLVGLSPGYFGNLFAAAVGVPPIVFATGMRVQLARELLRDREATITEVAYKAGFSSHQFMADTFRRILGTTPRDYQRRLVESQGEIGLRQKWAQWHFC